MVDRYNDLKKQGEFVSEKINKDIIEQFKNKLTFDEFNKYFENLKKNLREIPWSDKKNELQMHEDFRELATISYLCDKIVKFRYSIPKPTHIKWSQSILGEPYNNSIIYLNDSQQEIQFYHLVDEEKEKAFSSSNMNPKQARKNKLDYIKNDIDYDNEITYAEDFICEELEKAFIDAKKIQNPCWLIITYNSDIGFEALDNEDQRKYIFFQLETSKKELIKSLKEKVEKIIFIPFFNKFSTLRSFEFSDHWYINDFMKFSPKRTVDLNYKKLCDKACRLEIIMKLLIDRDYPEKSKSLKYASHALKIVIEKYGDLINDNDKKTLKKALTYRNKILHVDLDLLLDFEKEECICQTDPKEEKFNSQKFNQESRSMYEKYLSLGSRDFNQESRLLDTALDILNFIFIISLDRN